MKHEIDEFIANYGSEEAKKAAELQLELVGALKRLDNNEDFKLIIKYITEDVVTMNVDQLAFNVEGRGQLFEELVWRSQLKKELQMIRDTNLERVNEILEGE